MKASGLMFLRTAASVYSHADGSRAGVLLPVLERDSANYRAITASLVARWLGADALAFFDQHHEKLRAGRPLHLELDRLHAHGDELHANVVSCEFAPLAPSWQARDAAAPQPQHAS